MDAIQQQMFDTYRAARLGEIPPPLPGRHDWDVLRTLRDHWRSRHTLRANGHEHP
ncbi:hypothetical protein AB0L80_28520 [Streptomyces sp. NPDC052069]|uniref:hypothetical protein n=1 Tax=Streptomyces sp. NPDC052069 TaxID=3154650 RepID=UPI00343CAC56